MTMDVHPIDFQTMRVIEAHVSPSYLIHDLNYSDTFQSADVVAVLEVTEDIMTFQLPHRHTLYRATIVQWLKGESTRSLYLYQLEGYDPDHDVFIHLDLNVLLRPSERWLLFLNKRTMPRIPSAMVYDASWLGLQLLENRLYSLDHFNTHWQQILSADQAMPLDERRKLGLRYMTSMHERLHIENLSLREFIDTYC